MVKIDFKDKIENNSENPNLFLQTVKLNPNSKQTINLYMQGLLYNPNNFEVEIIINSVNGEFRKTLNPKQYFSIPYIYVFSVVNLGNGLIYLYYSNSSYGQFSTDELINILGSVNITNDTLNINGNVTGSMEITNSSINVLGSVNITDEVNTYITNPSLNVLGSVDISNSITGSVEISNPSLNVLGSVNIVNDISGTVNINNPSLNILGSVNISNESLNVLGSVNISNDITGSVEISNPSLNVLGSVQITNDITGSVEISNPSINILGSVNIGNEVNTDSGSYATNNQENQTSGTNIYTYNPWGFNTSSTPSIRVGSFSNYLFANVQQNGARGYLSFIFYVYNPTSTAGSTSISINLYSHLPETNAPSPIRSFSFNTGTIDATSGVWLQVTPSIFWEYNTLVVIPEQQSGTQNSTIGIGLPSNFNQINSHYWNGSYWNNNDDGFIGYWEIWNTSVASLPVTVQGGEVTITSTRKNPVTISGTFTSATSISPPQNKKWKIRSILITWTANATTTVYPEIQIYPKTLSLNYQVALNLFFTSLSVNQNDTYVVDIAEYVQSRSNQLIGAYYVTEFTVNKDLELYSNESLILYINKESATISYYISYIEENIN